jgi:surface antigen
MLSILRICYGCGITSLSSLCNQHYKGNDMKTNRLIRNITAASACVALLAACTQQGGQPNSGVLQGGGINKSDAGTVLGGVVGGVLGSNVGKGSGKTAGTIAGALLGAALGNSVGQSLDRADMTYYNQTSQSALERGQPGQSFPWSNAQSGNSGTVTPGQYYKSDSGQYCREFSQNITVGGKTQRGYGTACRQPDGSWRIVE